MELITNSNKPLGHRSYGSIPHLPGSRLGPGDYHIHEGQAKIATEKVRDKHDRVIIQEKLDGSNVAVAKVNGEILAITRAGYLANTSQYQQHLLFDAWVKDNSERFDFLLKDGERICGEWLAQAHGTIYNLWHEPFVAFDIMVGNKRIGYDRFIERVYEHCIVPNIVAQCAMPIMEAMAQLGQGKHGAVDPVEGIIYRVERKGVVDFLTKFVRSDKEDGKYLPERNGTGQPIFNTLNK
jgi:hypothetical protein